ncbi:interference hedgehog-like [Lepeophtheirus salmonis]|uniref:interference hedgehog-like n=1 Tax=Lepeophtheirus salmonis TaxID=72036 RepID=UPI003AF37528
MFRLLLVLECLLTFSQGAWIGFEERPQNSVANPGDTVYFNCKTNISEEFVQWTYKGQLISAQELSVYTISKNYLSFELGLTKDIYSKQIGEYQCIGRESIATLPANLSIAELKEFSSEGKNSSFEVTQGNDVIIHCDVPYSNPPGFVEYYRDGIYLEAEVLLNSEILFIKNVVPELHNGNYTCSVQNHIIGQKKHSKFQVELKVIPSHGNRRKSQIIYHPKGKYSVNKGESITIPCAASGFPNPFISWSRFGDSTAIVPSSHGLLQIRNATEENQGDYMCIVDDGARQFLRKTRLIVNTPPVFLKTPQTHKTLRDGDSLSLKCIGSGVPSPEIRWYHNGFPLLDQRSNHLYIHSVNNSHSGFYQCFIINIVNANYTVTLVRVLQNKNEGHDYNEDYEDYPLEVLQVDAATFLPPSKPNITQLSPDSAMISWDINKDSELAISFFKIQYREFHGKKRSEWKTLDEVIEPNKRNFEIIGLHSDRKYRFRIVAVYLNNDNQPGPLSKKFKFNKKLLRSKKPKIAPVITHLLPMSDTSLRIGWKMSSLADIEGYFILYRPGISKGRPFKKITIIGGSSHSYVIEDLQPGLRYEMRVQAFNFAGVSPLSRVMRRSTSSGIKSSSTNKPSLQNDDSSLNNDSEDDTLMEHQVRLYLLIGGVLALIVLLVIISCSVMSYIQKRKAIKTYSDTNVAIHEKYMDASLSQFRSAVHNRQSTNMDSVHSSVQNIPETCETSFSNKACSTLNSSSTSVGHSKHVPENKNKDLGYEEYMAEPSGSSWKRTRRSEEIL